MASAPTPQVFATVTLDPTLVPFGGTGPVLVAKDADEQQRLAMWMSRITNAAVHDLHNGVMLLVVNLPSAAGSG